MISGQEQCSFVFSSETPAQISFVDIPAGVWLFTPTEMFPNSLENQEKGMFTVHNIDYSDEAVILTLIFMSFTIFTTYFTASHNIIN